MQDYLCCSRCSRCSRCSTLIQTAKERFRYFTIGRNETFCPRGQNYRKILKYYGGTPAKRWKCSQVLESWGIHENVGYLGLDREQGPLKRTKRWPSQDWRLENYAVCLMGLEGIVHYELLLSGQTLLNFERYIGYLELANRKRVMFHKDNARQYTFLETRQKLRELGWDVALLHWITIFFWHCKTLFVH